MNDENSKMCEAKNKGRFSKGVSGNPKGRPRTRGLKVKPESILARRVAIKLGDETIKEKAPIAALYSLFASGLDGSSADMDAFLSLSAKHRKNLPRQNRLKKIIRVLVRPQTCDIALLNLGVIKEGNGVCRVEPWVVKEALKRNPALDVSAFDQSILLALHSKTK